jgi:pyrimidine-nucleoside phosphorylase
LSIRSGKRIDLSSLPAVKVDKHSTGGVGDKTSLLLGPIVASYGIVVPMITGRSLGHTGGTLDKLDSIPGFRSTPDEETFRSQLATVGTALIGQTDDIVPLDKRLYALRDVTATVPVLPMIGASIMSKKIAGGADALVLDVKTGIGAFMDTEEKAGALAALLMGIGAAFGLPVSGFLTDMNDPLGVAIGNWLEVVEVVDCLRGRPSPDLMEVTHFLAGEMIVRGGKAGTLEEGMALSKKSIDNGRAYEKFMQMVAAQNGDTKYIEETMIYPLAEHVREIRSDRAGYVASINARAMGILAIELGAGRKAITDVIDPTAGIILRKKAGDRVEEGDTLCELHCAAGIPLDHFGEQVLRAYSIVDEEPRVRSRIISYFNEEGFTPRG